MENSKEMRIFAPDIILTSGARLKKSQGHGCKEMNEIECVVIWYQRDGEVASIATDGHRAVTQEGSKVKELPSLRRAMADLSSRGYQVVIDKFV